jgi:6-phosphofructokinase 1
MHSKSPNDFNVKTLGKGIIKSPLKPQNENVSLEFGFIDTNDRILYNTTLSHFNQVTTKGETPISFEKAGPHKNLFFNSAKTKVAIVSCGGLCPGVNNVIQSLVNQLFFRYNVKQIVGVRYGFEGFIAKYNHSTVELTPQGVDKIHLFGGTLLGTSRGDQDVALIVDALCAQKINILFCIGGDGTLRGAHAIHQEIVRRKLSIAIAGIPKTIDNDISFIDKSFGFETAFTIANDIIRYAHNEAIGAYNGIAIVKLMGRNSGFIAAHAALSIHEVNFVLVPEVTFDLKGPSGFLAALQKRLENRHHALIVVAEGAGQNFFDNATFEKDASGNIKNKDIGLYLKDKISEEFESKNFRFTIKYIDPSYIIRSAPANANDSKFCGLLAQNAVHAAMAGKTDFVVGHWGSHFTLIPIPIAVSEQKRMNENSELWWNVLETTGQPASMKG